MDFLRSKISRENKEFLKELLVLAIPSGMQMMIMMVVNLVDNIMIGSLGEAAITAVTVGTTFTWLCSTAVMSFSNGASILSAQDYGVGNLSRIKKMMSLSLTIALVISFAMFIVVGLFPSQIIRIYSPYESIQAPGIAYLKWIKYTLPLMAISFSLSTILRAVKVVKLGLYNSIASCIFNIFFNYCLIFGHFGFPELGVEGAAIATLISRFIEVLVSLIYLFYFDKNLRFKITDYNPIVPFKWFAHLMKISIPLLGIDIINNLVTSAQTMITGRISEYYVTANSITHNAWVLPNVFCMGVGMASGIMMGQLLGSNEMEKADRYAKKFVVASLVLGLFATGMIQVLLPILMRFYDVTEATKTLATQMGYCAMITVIFISFSSVVCDGIIKAGGMTKQLFRINLIANWLVVIPFGYVAAFVLNWPAWSLYIILRGGNIIKSIWGLVVLKKGTWKNNLTDI